MRKIIVSILILLMMLVGFPMMSCACNLTRVTCSSHQNCQDCKCSDCKKTGKEERSVCQTKQEKPS